MDYLLLQQFPGSVSDHRPVKTRCRRRHLARNSIAIVSLAMLLLGFQGFASAQHGHPLVGTWSGYWGTSADQRNRVLLLLDYDGEAIRGVINPGRNAAPISAASLDASTWTLVLEASREDADGNTIAYRIEGRLENVTTPSARVLSGTWTEGNERGDFRVTFN